jgi:uncharacterized integral membrane protein
MASLLLAVILGTGFAILATQNTTNVVIHLGSYSWSHIPLYAIAIGSLFVGLVIAFLLSIFDWATSSLNLHRKEVRAHKAEASIASLETKIQDLEAANAALRAQLHETDEVHAAENPSPLRRFTHSLSH